MYKLTSDIERMYADNQDQLLSHFQIGGIHGLPYVSWGGSGGDEGSNPDDPAQWRGYCTHGMVTFPTWHRPYVALYEVRAGLSESARRNLTLLCSKSSRGTL